MEDALKQSEDRVGLFLNGGQCTKSTHDAATTLDELLMFKHLRLRLPHHSSQMADLEAAIRKELKRGSR